MKWLSLMLIGAVLVGMTACGVMRHQERPHQQPNVINGYGEWKPFPSLWIIVSRADQKISVRHFEREGSTVQTARDWNTETGWFVFVENAERVWIYNGVNLRLLLITPKVGSAVYLKDYPIAIPSVVKDSLAGR